MGLLGGRRALGSLVVRKKPAATVTAQQPAPRTQNDAGRVSSIFNFSG